MSPSWPGGAKTSARPRRCPALPAALGAERSLLRAVFRNAPAALFVLEPDGIIRRANAMAGDLVGAPPSYATGKPLTVFVDLASRAAVQSQLAAAARTGMARHIDGKLLTPAGPADVTLTAHVITPQDGARFLVVMAGGAGRRAGSVRRWARSRPARSRPWRAGWT